MNRRTHISTLCEDCAEFEEVLNDPMINNGKEKMSSNRLDLIWNRKSEAKSPKRLNRKSIFDSLVNMKRTFTANFYTNYSQLQTDVKSTESYTVCLTPQIFGDIFYFTIALSQESPAEEAIKFLHSQKSAMHEAVYEAADTNADASEEILSEEENYGAQPLHQSSFFNQKSLLEAKKSATTLTGVQQDTGSSPTDMKTFETRATDANRLLSVVYAKKISKKSTTLLSQQDTDNNPTSPNMRTFASRGMDANRMLSIVYAKKFTSKSTLAGKAKVKFLERPATNGNLSILMPQDAGFSSGQMDIADIASPVGSTNPLVQLLSESTDQPKEKVLKRGMTAKAADIDNMATSSVGTSSKNYMSKLEKAIRVMPQNPQVRILYLLLIVLLAISGAFLIAFNFQNRSTLEMVESSIGAISKSIFRLVRITDIGQYVRNVWQARIGLYRSDRYGYVGWDVDAGDLLSTQIYDILSDLNNKNNALRSFVYKLDPNLQDAIYSDRLPIYEMDNDGIIYTNRTGNTFDLITELVSQGRQMVDSGLPVNEHNPFLLFVLNNTFNDLLVASEKTIPILLQDNETKLNSQSLYIFLVLGPLGASGVLVLLFFFSIIKNFMNNRRHFINIFGMLDEKQIQIHIYQVQIFLSMLEATNSDSKNVLNRLNSKIHQDLPAAKIKNPSKNQAKKMTSTQGINSILTKLYGLGIFFMALIFSVYIVLIVVVSSGNNNILSKMNLMAQSNLNLYNTNFLLTTIYESLQERISTYVRKTPIKEEWEKTFKEMTKVQDFLLTKILEEGNGLSDNPMLQQIVIGSVCTAIPTTDINLARMCPIMGGGAVERGMVGLNSYTLASVKEVKDYYDYSEKTWDDMFYALSFEGLINIEVFYPFTYNAYVWIDDLIGSEISKNFDSYKMSVIKILMVYLVIYVIVGTTLSKKITGGLEKEMNFWRKILRQIPYAIVTENKLLKSYLAKISNGMLGK